VAAPAPAQAIYTPRLPTAEELARAADGQENSIERIEETPSEITVSYRTPGGQTYRVAYRLLPVVSPGAAAPSSTVVVPTPAPAMYATTPPVVYYESADGYYPRFYPRYWYSPVSYRVGGGHGFRHRRHR
jgi:hypothetical protein